MAMLILGAGGGANQGALILISWACSIADHCSCVDRPPNQKDLAFAGSQYFRRTRSRCISSYIAAFWLVERADHFIGDHSIANRFRNLCTRSRSAKTKDLTKRWSEPLIGARIYFR